MLMLFVVSSGAASEVARVFSTLLSSLKESLGEMMLVGSAADMMALVDEVCECSLVEVCNWVTFALLSKTMDLLGLVDAVGRSSMV